VRRSGVVTVLVLLTLTLSAGCSMTSAEPEENAPPLPTIFINDDLRLEYAQDAGVGSVTLTGTVTNKSDSSVSLVMIEFNLFDRNQSPVGTAMANNSFYGDDKLASGASARYEVTYFEANARDVALVQVAFLMP
jgi:hypothetical protein